MCLNILEMSVKVLSQSGQPWKWAVWRSSAVLDVNEVWRSMQSLWAPITNNLEEESGWIWFRWRVRWDELVKVRVYMWHVLLRSLDRSPGRDKEIQQTCGVRREMVKCRW